MVAVVSWSGWEAPPRARKRNQLSAISRFTDDELDQLYAALGELDVPVDENQTGERRAALVEKIGRAEAERAAEMSAIFWRRNPAVPAEIKSLMRKIDDFGSSG